MLSGRSSFAALCWVVAIVLFTVKAPSLAGPTTGLTGAITVKVFDQRSGLPVAGASAVLHRGDVTVGTMTTDSRGSVTFENLAAGTYSVEVTGKGYDTTLSADVVLGEGGVRSTIQLVLEPSTSVLGRVAVRGSGSQRSLQTSSTITNEIPAAQLLKENANRIGDTLGALPGVNLGSQSSAAGDDIFVNVRGMGVTETQTLLDGHPIGPIGVAPDSFFNGVPTAFDYQDSPFFALARSMVTYGSGAMGLYGTDSIGGTVDLQTLEPSIQPVTKLTEGAGNYGKMTTAIQATGTDGRLGYALVDAVQGTYGNFPTQQVYQGGLNGTLTVPTPSTVAGLTWAVSANYLLRNDLMKFRYQTSPISQLTLTAYSGTSWDDKSGNGDNDFNTYAYELYNTQQAAGTGNNAGCPGGIDLNQGNGTPNCITPQQSALYGTGPAGGGPSPWQAIRSQDYHGRYTLNLGKNLVALDGFFDNYAVDYNRNCGSIDSTGGCNGGYNTSFARTTGFLVSDDIATDSNDFGFGYYSGHQQLTGHVATLQGDTPNPVQSLGDGSFFLRDAWNPTSKLTYYANMWFKKSSVTQASTIDPRFTVQFRPTNDNVFRVTAGRATGEPAPALRFGFNLNTTPGNLNPNCSGLTSVGGLGNPNVGPETANDVEVAFGHRFAADSTMQIALYSAAETDRLYSVSLPATSLPPGEQIPDYLLSQYLARIKALCPTIPNPTIADLSVSTPENASRARYHGIEISGRRRFSDRFFTDFAYNIQSAIRYGVPDNILIANPFIINGSQIQGIPVHKWNLGLDYATPRGFEIRMDGYYIGQNNGLNRNGYFFANASISKDLSGVTSVNLGINNVFNNAADQYGRIGYGAFIPSNQFNPFPNALAEGSERFGLIPTQIQFTVTQKLGK